MSEQAAYAQVQRAYPQGHVEVRVMAGSPNDHGMAVTLTYGDARCLHDSLGELLEDAAHRTCTCGVGPYSRGSHGQCASCGGANVPASSRFTDAELDEIARKVSKRLGRQATTHLTRPPGP